MSTTILHNARIVTPGRIIDGWLSIEGSEIVQVNEGQLPASSVADRVIDAEGRLLLPGAIDEHVHFREPGMTSKATIAGESRAAVAGGVTSFLDMPNVIPATTTPDLIARKLEIAAAGSVANYGFYIGATADNLDLLPTLDYTAIAGVKLFIGATTGSMVLDDDRMLDRLFATVKVPVAVHAEDNAVIEQCKARLLDELDPEGTGDLPVTAHPLVRPAEACVKATRRAIDLARRHNTRLHIMHLSTAAELDLLKDVDRSLITAETCPQYLLFDSNDYATRGTRVKCNPAIKSPDDRLALVNAVREGLIDTIATDHAPHLPADKQGGALKAASGMPSIQFMLPLMLDLFDPLTVARTTAATPARIYGIAGRGIIAPGMKADIALVSELDTPRPITDDEVVSQCGWTPMDHFPTRHSVDLTMVNGAVAHSRLPGVPLDPPAAQQLTFKH